MAGRGSLPPAAARMKRVRLGRHASPRSQSTLLSARSARTFALRPQSRPALYRSLRSVPRRAPPCRPRLICTFMREWPCPPPPLGLNLRPPASASVLHHRGAGLSCIEGECTRSSRRLLNLAREGPTRRGARSPISFGVRSLSVDPRHQRVHNQLLVPPIRHTTTKHTPRERFASIKLYWSTNIVITTPIAIHAAAA